MSETDFPYRSPTLYDEVVADNKQGGQAVYKDDCYNLPFCESKEQTAPFLACVRGANAGYRCERGDKIILLKLSEIEARLARLEEHLLKSVDAKDGH